jgi:hypothetical protein
VRRAALLLPLSGGQNKAGSLGAIIPGGALQFEVYYPGTLKAYTQKQLPLFLNGEDYLNRQIYTRRTIYTL